MSAPRIQPRFTVGTTVWAVNSYGAVFSGPVCDVTDSIKGVPVHSVWNGTNEVFTHPCFAREIDALEYAREGVEAQLYTIRRRIREITGKEAAV